MAVLGRSRSGPPPDQILDPPLVKVLRSIGLRKIIVTANKYAAVADP